VVPGNDEERPLERAEQGGRPAVLLARVAMGEVPARDNELRFGLGHQRTQVSFDLRLFPRPHVEIRHLEDA
jgi:hypothetical protein